MSLQLINTLHTSTHDQTSISRENRKIERKLEREINNVCRLIRRIYGETSAKTITQIQGLLDREIEEIIASNIQRSYSLGIAYVSNLLKHEPYMTTSDIWECDELTRDYKRRFWGRVNLLIQKLLNSQISEAEVPESNGIVTSIATDITTKTLNLATKNRTKLLIGKQQDELRFKPKIRRILSPGNLAFAGIKDIEDRLEAANPGIFGTLIAEQPAQVIKLVWVISQDDRVCELCQDLEGSQYDINSFDVPSAGHEGTHWGCRCRLLLAEVDIT